MVDSAKTGSSSFEVLEVEGSELERGEETGCDRNPLQLKHINC